MTSMKNNCSQNKMFGSSWASEINRIPYHYLFNKKKIRVNMQ
jgi:hypothetical protein